MPASPDDIDALHITVMPSWPAASIAASAYRRRPFDWELSEPPAFRD